MATYHKADNETVNKAIKNSLETWKTWSNTPLEERTSIFRRAGDLLADKWRDKINAATMLKEENLIFKSVQSKII